MVLKIEPVYAVSGRNSVHPRRSSTMYSFSLSLVPKMRSRGLRIHGAHRDTPACNRSIVCATFLVDVFPNTDSELVAAPSQRRFPR